MFVRFPGRLAILLTQILKLIYKIKPQTCEGLFNCAIILKILPVLKCPGRVSVSDPDSLIPDPDPALRLNINPNPDPDPDPKIDLKNLQLENFLYFFDQKLQFAYP
jgi:hypothetical protein